MSQNLSQILANAYTYIRSQEVNESTSSLTLDHLIQERIQYLKSGEITQVVNSIGQGVSNHTSRYDQLDNLEKSLNAVVSAMQSAGNNPAKLDKLGLQMSRNGS